MTSAAGNSPTVPQVAGLVAFIVLAVVFVITSPDTFGFIPQTKGTRLDNNKSLAAEAELLPTAAPPPQTDGVQPPTSTWQPSFSSASQRSQRASLAPSYSLSSGLDAVRGLRLTVDDVSGFVPRGIRLKPSKSTGNGHVAVGFYGLIRFSNSLERMWTRTRSNLDAGRFPYDVFVSTWNYMQTDSFGSKQERRTKKQWFSRGRQVDDMVTHLAKVFVAPTKLRGWFIGNHSQVVHCDRVACVLAIARVGCLLAVAAAEFRQKEGTMESPGYSFFMFTRIDRSVEFPTWFSPPCWQPNGTSAPPSLQLSSRCTFHVGNCRSYYRGHFFAPFAVIDQRTVVTFLFYTRFPKGGPMERPIMVSDYAAIGTPDAVTSLLVAAAQIAAVENQTEWFAPESLIADAAERLGILIGVVNLGFDQPISIGVQAPLDLSSPAVNLTVIDGNLTSSTPTCGTLAPKYLRDSCAPELSPALSVTPSAAAAIDTWRNPPHVRWFKAAKSCCDTMAACRRLERGGKRR